MHLEPSPSGPSRAVPRSGGVRRAPAGRPRSRRFLANLERLDERCLPSTLTVTSLMDNPASFQAGDGSLRGEIAAAAAGDSIAFGPVLAGGTIKLGGVALGLSRNLTIAGPSGGITVDGNLRSGVFAVGPGVTASLSGLVIANGMAAGNGGGIDDEGAALGLDGVGLSSNQCAGDGGGVYVAGGTLTASNCSFSNAFLGGSGGAIFNHGGAVTVSNSSVTGNHAIGDGGGIDNAAGGTLGVSNTTFDSNQAADGGAILNDVGGKATLAGGSLTNDLAFSNLGGAVDNLGNLTATGVRFSGSSSGGDGGTIANGGILTVMASSLLGGNAADGGGIANERSGSAKLINSTFAEDAAGGSGGGVYDSGGPLLLTNCTILLCSAGSGGGVAVAGGSGPATLANTLVAHNSSGDVNGPVLAEFSLIGATSGATLLAGSGGDQLNVDPGLAGLSNFGGPTTTAALLPTSPAIDAGSNALAVDASGNPLATDQRGGPFARVSGPRVDIGAFEYETFNLVVSTATDEDDGNLGFGHLSLREAIGLVGQNFAGSNTIAFDPTVFANPQTIALDPTLGPLVLNDAAVVITGPASGLTVAGDNAGRFLVITSNSLDNPLSISELTITGGGIKSGGGTLSLTGVDFVNNANTATADTRGGGLESVAGLNLTDCNFTGNTAVQGGGLYNANVATSVGCTFSGNRAVDSSALISGLGGAIANTGQWTDQGSVIAGNSASLGGGGIYSPGPLSLTDATLSSDTTLGYGGAIAAEVITPNVEGLIVQAQGRGPVTLTGCTFQADTAVFGGALDDLSTVTVAGCTFSGNQSNNAGGAVDVEGAGGSGRLTATNSTFQGNSSYEGGAIEVAGEGGAIEVAGVASVVGCTFSSNTSIQAGGAVDVMDGGTAGLANSTFASNASKFGGAVANGDYNDPFGGYLTLTQDTFAGNSASSSGGAVVGAGGSSALGNCTISGNQAGSGAGVAITQRYPNFPDQVTLVNSIAAGNADGATPDDVSGPIVAKTNLIGAANNATFLAGSGGNQLGVAQVGLGPLANYGGLTSTFALLPGSPAIDAGNSSLALLLSVTSQDPTGMTGAVPLATDQRGAPRVVGAAVDLGAFESGGFTIQIAGGSNQSAPVNSPFASSLQVSVAPNRVGDPVAGGVVTFTPVPGPSGASASLSASGAAIDANGVASVTATANGQAGAFIVAPSATGAQFVGNGSGATGFLLININPTTVAAVGVGWGAHGSASLATDPDGLRLLPAGRKVDLPWQGIRTITITLATPAPLAAPDVSVRGIVVADYGPVTVSGSGSSYTITLARSIDAADRVTITLGNAAIATFTRRLDVLPGDVGDLGVVNAQDLALERDLYLNAPIPDLPAALFGDILGDGLVDVANYNAVRSKLGTKLPPLP